MITMTMITITTTTIITMITTSHFVYNKCHHFTETNSVTNHENTTIWQQG
jgi:hypothetical protein